MSKIGHNSGLDEQQKSALMNIIERVEEHEAEKAKISEYQREAYAEGKAYKLDPKVIRKIVALRKMDADKRRNEAELLELYKRAVNLD